MGVRSLLQSILREVISNRVSPPGFMHRFLMQVEMVLLRLVLRGKW